MFVPGKPFQPSLMFVGKARSLPYCGAPEKVLHSGRLWPYRQILQRFSSLRGQPEGGLFQTFKRTIPGSRSSTAPNFIEIGPMVGISILTQTHTHTHTHIHTHTHRERERERDKHRHTDTHRHTNTQTHTDTHRHTQTHTDTHRHTNTQTHTHTHTNTHTPIPTHTHTHTHTHTLSFIY